MNKILDALRTPVAMLLALVLALVAQLEHTAQVFMQVVNAQGIYAQVHSYAFAVAVETAVLLFVLAGHRRISYGFAIATALTNLSYYAMQGVDLLSVQGAPAWLMSLLLPAAIVGYSHTIADAPRAGNLPEYSPAVPSEATTAQRKKNNPNRHAVPPVPAPLSATETHSESVDASARPLEQTGEKSADSPPPAPAKLSPAQRQTIIKAQGYKTTAEVMQAFGIKERAANGDLAEVRKAVLHVNGANHD